VKDGVSCSFAGEAFASSSRRMIAMCSDAREVAEALIDDAVASTR
jgi:hypothetical protein